MEELKIGFYDPIEQFEAVKRSDEFVEYQKEFAKLLTFTLCREYPNGEVLSVQAFNDFVNSYPNLTKTNLQAGKIRFDLVANSVFVHGKKSQVEFDYPGQTSGPVELGDLIFICTLVFQGKRYFERMTISQFKMDNDTKNIFSWTIDNDKQLYLLSRFPKFKCVEGILPKKEYSLPNTSGCLGSYGLIQKPGDFTFVSGTRLDALLGKRKTIRKYELYGNSAYHRRLLSYRSIINGCHLCLDAYSFADNYLGLNIGEPIVVLQTNHNLQARAILGYLVRSLRVESKKGRPTPGVARFIDSFRQFPYADGFGQDDRPEDLGSVDENNGIGIVHATVKLGE